MGGCSLDDQELDRLEAERLASSAAASASASARPGSRDDRGLPLSWRAAKASEAKGCGKAECACKADAGVAPAAPMPRRNCGKCRDKLAQVRRAVLYGLGSMGVPLLPDRSSNDGKA